jgi:hypothetical protein
MVGPGHPRDGERLAAILAAWLAARGDGGASLERLFEEAVVWRSLRPELRCTGRDAVVAMLIRRAGLRRLTSLEGREANGRVAISVRSPDFEDTDLHAANEPRSLVFTFVGPLIVDIESARTPEDAFSRLDT